MCAVCVCVWGGGGVGVGAYYLLRCGGEEEGGEERFVEVWGKGCGWWGEGVWVEGGGGKRMTMSV